MKRNNVLEIHFQSIRDFEKEVTSAVSKRKRLIQPKSKIYFESVNGFRNFMTVQKVEILSVIAVREPKTIYEVAKMVDRDFAAVLRDCTALEVTGFIKLRETNNAKRSKKPVLVFPYRRISIHLPHSPYQIEFKNAA
jgi:predicted transcriptional regulator